MRPNDGDKLSNQAAKRQDRKPRDTVKASDIAKLLSTLTRAGLRDEVSAKLSRNGRALEVGLRREALLKAVIEACRDLPKAR